MAPAWVVSGTPMLPPHSKGALSTVNRPGRMIYLCTYLARASSRAREASFLYESKVLFFPASQTWVVSLGQFMAVSADC